MVTGWKLRQKKGENEYVQKVACLGFCQTKLERKKRKKKGKGVVKRMAGGGGEDSLGCLSVSEEECLACNEMPTK